MKTSTLSPKIRKDIVHFIVLSLAITFLLTQYRLDYINETLLWQPLAIGFFGLLAFYLHSLILLPILLKKAKVKRYLFYTIIAFILFYFIESWLQASYLRASLKTVISLKACF